MTRLTVGPLCLPVSPIHSCHRLLVLPFKDLGGDVAGLAIQACSSDFWLGFASRGTALAFHVVCLLVGLHCWQELEQNRYFAPKTDVTFWVREGCLCLGIQRWGKCIIQDTKSVQRCRAREQSTGQGQTQGSDCGPMGLPAGSLGSEVEKPVGCRQWSERLGDLGPNSENA